MPDPIESEPQTFMEVYEASLAAEEAPPTEVTTTVETEVAPVEDGTGTEVPPATESGTPVEPEVEWDWSTVSSKPIPIKVGGEEVQVTLEELRNGYMRQADYTRKTQETAELRKAAEWAQNFQRQLKEDPSTVLRMLQAAFPDAVATHDPDPIEVEIAKLVEDDPSLKPFAQVLLQERQRAAALEAQLAQQASRFQETETQRQQREIVQMVEAEIASVDAKYEDFNADEILPIAAATNLPLERAYLLNKMEKGEQPKLRGAAPAAPAPTPPAPEPKTAAKQALAATTTNVRNVATPEVADDDWQTFDELFEIMSKTS